MKDKSPKSAAKSSNKQTNVFGQGFAPPSYGINFVDQQSMTNVEPIQGMFESSPVETSSVESDGANFRVGSSKSLLKSKSLPNKTGLPDNLKSGIENLSGFSMDSVRVHYNSSRPAQLNAYAYTQGSEIHVAPGQEQHLPHEAWHVIQQKQGRVKPTIQLKENVNVNDEINLEKEADLMGTKALNVNPLGKVSMHLISQPKNISASSFPVSIIQRLEYKLNIQRSGNYTGLITGIKLTGKSRPGSNLGGQGDHSTAYTTFEDMVENAVYYKKPKDALKELKYILEDLWLFPGAVMAQNAHRNNAQAANFRYYMQLAANDIDVASKSKSLTVQQIADIMVSIVTARNRMPYTSYRNGNKGGNEDYHQILNNWERDIQRASVANFKRDLPTVLNSIENDQNYYDRNIIVWDLLFAFDHPKNYTNDQIKDVYYQHIDSIHRTYPLLFKYKILIEKELYKVYGL